MRKALLFLCFGLALFESLAGCASGEDQEPRDDPSRPDASGIGVTPLDPDAGEMRGPLDGGADTGGGADGGALAFDADVPAELDAETAEHSSEEGGVAESDAGVDAGPTWILGGVIEQSSGATTSNEVHVFVYSEADAVANPIAQTAVTVSAGEMVAGAGFSLELHEGTYWVRAFRDEGGPRDIGPDGLPTIPIDPQSSAAGPFELVGGDQTDVALTLVDVIGSDRYELLDAYTNHETKTREPIYYDDPDGESDLRGTGACGGFHLKATGTRVGTALSPLAMLRPDGRSVVLIDDGGCSREVHDNSSGSFDQQPADDRLSWGEFNPTSDDNGSYTFYYRVTDRDFIHLEIDELVVTKLSRRMQLTSPTTASPVPPSTTFGWTAATGAVGYQFIWGNRTSQVVAWTSETTFTPESDLEDDTVWTARIEAYDAHPGDDLDARAVSPETYFVTNSSGDGVVTISGTITNESSADRDFVISAIDADGYEYQSRVILPPGSSAYSLAMFPTSDALLKAFIDVDESGARGGVNSGYELSVHGIDAQTNVTVDLLFREPPQLVRPALWAESVETRPVFEWMDYEEHAPATWSYALFAGPAFGSDGFPDLIFGLPNTTTSYDMAAPPSERFDVVSVATCIDAGGLWRDTGCEGAVAATSLDVLPGATELIWGIVIVECDFGLWTAAADGDADGVNDYAECLVEVLEAEVSYAGSMESSFVTE